MSSRTCPICDTPIDGVNRGRTRTYCSGRCRTRACRQRNLPTSVRAERRWAAADGKRPTVSTTNPDTWATYAEVKHGPHGVMLGDGLACIDIDGCVGPRGGIADWAQRIIDAVPGAYVELSVSGTGLHVFGHLPEGAGRVRGPVEVYSRQRFIRTTGVVARPGGLVDLGPAAQRVEKMWSAGVLPARPNK